MLCTGDSDKVQLPPVLADLPRMGRRFSETINIDDSHRLPDTTLVPPLQPTAKLEKSEFFVRRTSLPQAVKMDVEIALPSPVSVAGQQLTRETRLMQLAVPLPAQPRRFSETVVMDLGTRHRSALEFKFQRAPDPIRTPLAVSSKYVTRTSFDFSQSKQSAKWMLEKGTNWQQQELNTRVDRPASTVCLQKTTDIIDGCPPYFVIGLEPLKVMDGEKARFYTLVAGSPKPEISWLHDGKPVKENPDFHLTYNKQTGSVGLEILEVFPQDSGQYECVANNEYGTASVTARLTVEGISTVCFSVI